jgi:peptidoglycan/xylan/chitin deacetylase (PgdA/CDA1 family)
VVFTAKMPPSETTIASGIQRQLRKMSIGSFRHFGGERFLRSRKPQNSVTVLALHRVTPQRNFFWQPMLPEQFDRLLTYCVAHYRVVSFKDFHDSNGTATRPRLILTFDDGYHDFVEYAMPILREHGLGCNHNVVVDCVDGKRIPWTQQLNILLSTLRERDFRGKLRFIGQSHSIDGSDTHWMRAARAMNLVGRQLAAEQRAVALDALRDEHQLDTPAERMMDWNDLHQVAAEGVEIGSHTTSHDSLPTIAEDERLRRELVYSKHRLETELKQPVDIFAVPNGHYNGHVLEQAAAAGYRKILLGGDDMWESHAEAGQPSEIVPRVNIVSEDTDEMIMRIEGLHRLVRKVLR